MKLSSRERLWVGIFITTLIWGIYNYRHVWLTDTTPPVVSKTAPSGAATAGTPASAQVDTTTHSGRSDSYQVPPWSSDPFNRPWRRVTGPTAKPPPSRG